MVQVFWAGHIRPWLLKCGRFLISRQYLMGAVAMKKRALEACYNLRVELCARATLQFVNSLPRLYARTIGPIGSHGVIGVGNRQNVCSHLHFTYGRTFVLVMVEILVMGPDKRNSFAQHTAHRRKYLCSALGMAGHNLYFFAAERSCFADKFRADIDFADIMQQRRDFDIFNLLGLQLHGNSYFGGIMRNPHGMALRVFIGRLEVF